MLRILLLASALGSFQDSPDASKAPPAAEAERPAAQAEALARYNAMMALPPNDAAGHWKLGLWCEQNGLKPEAYLHYGKVIELDPRRDAAWLKLGFKKVGGHWRTADQLAAEASQKKVDKDWSARFKALHKAIHCGKSPGRTAKDWRTLLAASNEGRSARRPPRTTPKPTLDEVVPLAYVPDLAAAFSSRMQTAFITQTMVDS